jgi:hypothetical protein
MNDRTRIEDCIDSVIEGISIVGWYRESNKIRVRIVNSEIPRKSEEAREITRLEWRIYTLT